MLVRRSRRLTYLAAWAVAGDFKYLSNQSAIGLEVGQDRRPAVAAAFLDDQLGRHAGFLELLHDQLRLLQRHQLVGVAVNDQRRRVVARDVVDRRHFLADLLARFQVDRLEQLRGRVLHAEIERRLEAVLGLDAQRLHARLAVVQEIGRRKETGHGLHAAADAIDRILGLRDRPSLPAQPSISDKWPPAEAPLMPMRLRIDLEVGRVVANVAHRAVHVGTHSGIVNFGWLPCTTANTV